MKAPEWVELIPNKGKVIGRDGRHYFNNNPKQLEKENVDIPVDWEHSTERLAPKGIRSPAVGWIKSLKAHDNGSVWGKVEWNDDGKEDILTKKYRFLSPVYLTSKTSRDIISVISVGLTNSPNLFLTALNNRGGGMDNIKQSLGLSPEATEEDIAREINVLKVTNLEQYVPRVEFDKLVTELNNQKEQIKRYEEEKNNSLIEEFLQKNINKFYPSQREHYKALCSQQNGLDLVKKVFSVMPDLTQSQQLNTIDKLGSVASSEASERIANLFGRTVADLNSQK